MYSISLRSILLTILAFGALASPASAADRYASASGPESPSAECSAATPCGIVTAINQAADGDTIHLASGTYGSALAPITANLGAAKSDLKLRGASPFAKPLLHVIGNSGQPPLTLRGDTAFAEDIRVESYSSPAPALYGWGQDPAPGAPTFSRVEIATSANASTALTGGNFYNSILINRSENGDALSVHVGVAEPRPIEQMELRGVTLWAYGTGADGLSIGSSGGVRREIHVTNSIIHGGAFDIKASADAVNQSRAYVVAENSSFQTIDQGANDSFITPPGNGSNTMADPIFLNLAGGDLRPAAGSPLIDAGVDSPANGTADAGGRARVQGARVDIGAHEATVTTQLSGLKAKSSKFLVARSGASLRASSSRPKAKRGKKSIGTLIDFTLSQADQVTFRLEQSRSGRRAGGKCVKETRKNRRAKRCSYYAPLRGSAVFAGVAGANAVWFTGRWGGKKLSTNGAKYRLTATPTISGLGGAPATSATRTFRPVRR